MTSRGVSRLGPIARLAALLATSYFLIATSEPYYGPTGQICNHPYQSVVFHVSGTCGPEGTVTMMSLPNECAISLQGGGDAGLPTAGRFVSTMGNTVNLTTDTWMLSGYLQEGATLPGAGTDAGLFGVESDAQASPGPGQGPTVPHGSLVKRECYNSYQDPLGVLCRDGSAGSSCWATLTIQR